jgi:hypothetical protein
MTFVPTFVILCVKTPAEAPKKMPPSLGAYPMLQRSMMTKCVVEYCLDIFSISRTKHLKLTKTLQFRINIGHRKTGGEAV